MSFITADAWIVNGTNDYLERTTGRNQHDLLDDHVGLLPTYRVQVTTETGDLTVDREMTVMLQEMYARLVALESGA